MISLEWVQDYIDISNEDLKELALKITKAGINIEKVISNHIDNLVIGEVVECKMHPDSDHLHVCQVNVGEYTTQIVCGAPNVRENLKVIVALIGAVLPGDFEIKKSKIRGIESNGMICALYELGLEEKNDITYAKGIAELDSSAPIGMDPIKFLGLEDTLYELDIHKHRNNDCYSHIGFAYEISAILNKCVVLPDDSFNEIGDNINKWLSVSVETDKCPYYLAKMVSGVTIKDSPDFIKKRLISAGMRSINNVVDISNYVMLEYGQPLHFFDKDKLGSKIVVRNAVNEEKIVTLDKNERVLNENDIVITDGINPICVAGVMGGESTEVDYNTKNIIIESAIFDPISIRYTSQKLGLRSEASIRYGKGLSYEYTEKAINRACYLLEKYADAKILTGIIRHDNIDKKDEIVKFKASDINKMLGITISTDDMKYELSKLGFEYVLDGDLFTVTIPKRRLDIDPNVNDIAEEIGRLYGYDNLVSTLPKTNIKKGEYIGDVKYRKMISRRLRSLGLNEAKTYTLVSPDMSKQFRYDNKDNIILPNPMSVDKSVIRTSLIPSLMNVYEYNKKHRVDDVFIYEISKTYDVDFVEDSKVALLMNGSYISSSWQNSNLGVDFYLVKGIIENILDYLGFKNRYTFVKDNICDMHPGISAKILLDREEIGIIGRVHPKISNDDIYVAEFSMTKLLNKKIKPIKYKEVSKYPSIVKDMAFIIDRNKSADQIMAIIKKTGGRLLTDIDIFDVYQGDNLDVDKKSIAFSLTFSDSTRTLTDEEVMVVFNKIIENVTTKEDAVLRDK